MPARFAPLPVVLLALCLAAPGAAAEPETRCTPILGPDVRVSGGASTATESSPDVAADSSGERFLVVWIDQRRYPGDIFSTDVFAQLMAADGARIGPNRRLSASPGHPSLGRHHPSVAWNPVSGQWLVVWGEHDRIVGQAVDLDGSRAGGNFTVGGGVDATFSPEVAADPVSGTYLVVWTDRRNSATHSLDVYGRRLHSDLRQAGTEFRISDPAATGLDGLPAVAADPGGAGFLVVWVDERNGDPAIYSQRVKPGGRMPEPNVKVSGPNQLESNSPAVAAGEAGKGFLVVWTNRRDGADADVLARRMTNGGSRKGKVFAVSKDPVREDVMPGAAWDGRADRWLVVWGNEDWTAGAQQDSVVHARVVKRTGVRSRTVWEVATGSPPHPLQAAIAWSPAGRHLVAWVVGGPETHPEEIVDRVLHARTVALPGH